MNYRILTSILITATCILVPRVSTLAQPLIISFYNCENLYDTINNIGVIDEDFIPNGVKGYNQKAYDLKIRNIASVIYHLGSIDHANGIALMGLAEVENKLVLTALVNENVIKKFHYRFIHFDAKDPRGIDVALIYNPVHFTPYQFKPFSLTDETHFTHYATRDILLVKGLLDNEWVYILLNHWPSRRGSGMGSSNKRKWASLICRKIMDSIEQMDPKAKIIVMGDFNDNPNNQSIRMLKMYNPFLKLFQNGLGSIAFNDRWNLFDQILLSNNWNLDTHTFPNKIDITNYKPIIYTNNDMIEWAGKYRGYPKRTYNGNDLRGGYSDHFPIALIFKPKTSINQH